MVFTPLMNCDIGIIFIGSFEINQSGSSNTLSLETFLPLTKHSPLQKQKTNNRKTIHLLRDVRFHGLFFKTSRPVLEPTQFPIQ